MNDFIWKEFQFMIENYDDENSHPSNLKLKDF